MANLLPDPTADPVPETERTNPVYAAPHRQLREPWITLNTGWSLVQVQAKIDRSPDMQFLLQEPIQREVYFAPHFRNSKTLTDNRLYAAVVQSRGDIVRSIPCHRCATDRTAVFEQCVSRTGMADDACAADIWAKSESSCGYNSVTGCLVDPAITQQSPTTVLRNQALLSANQLQAGGRSNEVSIYNANGLIADAVTVRAVGHNLTRTRAMVLYRGEQASTHEQLGNAAVPAPVPTPALAAEPVVETDVEEVWEGFAD